MLSVHEHSRLAALASYDILDTPKERDFDDVAALASEICETPIAVVNLIGDGRQFFKAEVGLGVRETPLDSSFCARAIMEEEFLMIPDATQDPRFDCNPLVTGEPGLRFYAGALLKTDEGYAIGTVCVLDTKPRHLNLTQQKTLRVLARQVMNQLDLRLALRKRTEMAERELRLLQERDVANQQAQATQRLINAELNHRIKNTFAMVQAIATQTLRKVKDEAVEAFTERLHALSQAHDVLLQTHWAEADLREVVAGGLAAWIDDSRLQLTGPAFQLGARTTLSLSLLLHELATNASKYGALSSDSGNLSVSWQVVANIGNEASLVFNWVENGGPPAKLPVRKGFGSRLIAMGLVGSGGAELHYGDDGFRAVFTAPVSQVQMS